MNSRNTISGALAIMLALSVMTGGAFAAAPSIDTSTTDDTATTSELAPGGTITNFTANASEATVIQYKADSNESKLDIAHNGTGDMVYKNSSPTTVFWNTTDNDGHFNISINHGALADLERGINANVTIDVTTVNNTSASSPANTTDQAYIETTDAYSVEYISASDVSAGEIVEVSEPEAFNTPVGNFSLPAIHSQDYSDLSTTRNVSENTTVVLALGDSSVAEDFTSSTDDIKPLPGGGAAESGDRLWSATATVDGEPVPVYYEQAPDSADTNETHAIYTEDHGGTPSVKILNHGSTDTVDVNMIGSASFGQAFDVYGLSMLSPMSVVPVNDLFAGLGMSSFQATRA